MNQLTLADALAQRDEAMTRVAEHAPPDWRDTAWEWLLDYLRTHESFFPDDAWQAGLEEPPNARAFGPIVARAARAGLIVRSGQLRPRTRGHATPGAVWRSTVYEREVA